MRRPLFVTGFPQRVPFHALPVTTADALLVFDMRTPGQAGLQRQDLQNHVYLLTLYAYAPTVDAGAPLTVYYKTGSEDLVECASYTFPAPAAAGEAAAPVKILDKMPFRGSFSIWAVHSTDADDDVRIFGYWEIDGETRVPQDIRPLQPTNSLTSPYNAGPVEIPASDDPVATPIHQLQSGYVDEVTLRYKANSGGGGEFPLIPTISLGDESFSMNNAPTGSTDVWITLFDGIPMISEDALKITSEGGVYQGSFKRN